MKRAFITLIALVFSTLLALADPSGLYSVEGVSLDGEAYKAELQVVKSGDVYELTYTFEDGTEQHGSAVGDDNFLAYGYSDDENTGVGLMTAKDGKWEGVWTQVGASKMSTEMWTKK
ncbi:MAG: hypothetical protein ACK5JR_01610 [Tropicimonas sp.]|uniref:hypothetical protein n=1 Tax=Tropicimonas sp. TaxID=2067044 RepID=UPI003A8A093A